eukprot:SAG22_NODE_2258_length_2779_cov_1.213433_2_plen_243_part_00
MLRAAERPPNTAPLPRAAEGGFQRFKSTATYPLDLCDDEHTPPRRQMAGMGQRCQGLAASLEASGRASGRGSGDKTSGTAAGPSKPSSPRPAPSFHGPSFVPKAGMKRLMREMCGLASEPHPAITVLPGEEDISFWHAVVDGPAGTPYANGAWTLAISFPEEYPLRAPEIRFITPILHCNVNSHGKICHSIFDRNYSADTSMATMLSCVYGLLLTPDKHDPVDSTLALSANNDSGEYEGAIM